MLKNFIKLNFVRNGKYLFRNKISVGDKLTIRCASTFSLDNQDNYKLDLNIKEINLETDKERI